MSNFLPNVRKIAESLSRWVIKRPGLARVIYRLGEWHNEKMGYRKYGLLRDDLIFEEHDIVKEALGRLSEKEQFDRTFRQRRAIQLNLNHELLSESEWIKPQDDKPYLFPIILRVCKERDEKDMFDRLQPNTLSHLLKPRPVGDLVKEQ